MIFMPSSPYIQLRNFHASSGRFDLAVSAKPNVPMPVTRLTAPFGKWTTSKSSVRLARSVVVHSRCSEAIAARPAAKTLPDWLLSDWISVSGAQ